MAPIGGTSAVSGPSVTGVPSDTLSVRLSRCADPREPLAVALDQVRMRSPEAYGEDVARVPGGHCHHRA
ncbi:hypothetical protein GCM10027452_19450 [Micromonospora halotolerans]